MCVCGFPTVPARKVPTLTFFRENVQKITEDLFKNLYVALGSTTSCIRQLKCQRFVSSVPFNVMRWFNFLVNDLVYLNLARFCFSVPYALCIEKRILPTYSNFFEHVAPKTHNVIVILFNVFIFLLCNASVLKPSNLLWERFYFQQEKPLVSSLCE